uniref:Uncharacterized protein n=1 Tax=Trichogramma kaykai TaxID=54128 RepID=A0ABD2WZM0_9HYME
MVGMKKAQRDKSLLTHVQSVSLMVCESANISFTTRWNICTTAPVQDKNRSARSIVGEQQRQRHNAGSIEMKAAHRRSSAVPRTREMRKFFFQLKSSYRASSDCCTALYNSRVPTESQRGNTKNSCSHRHQLVTEDDSASSQNFRSFKEYQLQLVARLDIFLGGKRHARESKLKFLIPWGAKQQQQQQP